jgi:hypothetical protein
VARVALQSEDVELVAVNDPFITTDYMVRALLVAVRPCVDLVVYLGGFVVGSASIRG